MFVDPWVFDLKRQKLLFKELVSHGRGSGNAEAESFSNIPESYQSSIGLFRTLNSYYGRNGYSLRLKENQYLFTYYPDPEWLATSEFLTK